MALYLRIDGRPHTIDGARTVLDALRAAHVDVPTICHDDRLQPAAVCRICAVEIEGRAHVVPACSTLAEDGMVIRTTSTRILAHRFAIVSLLSERVERRHDAPSPIDASNPYIRVDMSRCVDCFRCVRVCAEVQGQFVWSVRGRGESLEVFVVGGSLRESACVSCGACVTACPTGAIDDKQRLELGAPTAHVRTTCAYCGVGCELDVHTRDGRIVQVLPTMDAPVNRGHACVKGRYAFGFVESPDRLTQPLVRDGRGFREATWDEATALIASRMREILAKHGPASVGVLGSARSTNEENYVAQKFARVVLGTNNVDCCARVCHAPSAAALTAMLGTGAATASFDDVDLARTILVCGANATEAHPVIGARIRRRALHGANLIVIDPRRIELARVPGAIHLQVKPGGNVALLAAMANVIVSEGLVDEAFIAARATGWNAYRAFVERYAPEGVEALTGVSASLVRLAARVYAKETPSIAFHGLGVTEHVRGTEGVMAIINLAVLTGNLGQPGTGVNPLRGQNNVQGAAHMGCEPSKLTGNVAIDDATTAFEEVWRAPIPTTRGFDMFAMLDHASRGDFKALWAMGYDILLTNPQMARTRASLERLELLVVQDIFMNETARAYAHVVLPAACAYEKDGTFMNAERRIQRVRKAVHPPGAARPDWEPLCDLARAMGRGEGFAFRSAEDVWNEIRRVWPAGAGISYARLERGGLQWPCPTEVHPGTTRLHTSDAGPRVELRCVDFVASPEATDDDFPFVLNTGRNLYQFNAGTMTMRTPNCTLRPTDRLDVAPDDARALGIHEGDRVRVVSRYGEATLETHVDDGVRTGELFATFNGSQSGRATPSFTGARTTRARCHMSFKASCAMTSSSRATAVPPSSAGVRYSRRASTRSVRR